MNSCLIVHLVIDFQGYTQEKFQNSYGYSNWSSFNKNTNVKKEKRLHNTKACSNVM
jgi:hypothetical protein